MELQESGHPQRDSFSDCWLFGLTELPKTARPNELELMLCELDIILDGKDPALDGEEGEGRLPATKRWKYLSRHAAVRKTLLQSGWQPVWVRVAKGRYNKVKGTVGNITIGSHDGGT